MNRRIVHELRLEGAVRGLYDVAVIPGRRNPSLTGFRGDGIRGVLSVEGTRFTVRRRDVVQAIGNRLTSFRSRRLNALTPCP